ncbi:alpha/beta fold hydrolase [Pedobacter duraquae]|uniref:Pimeloyl-ACP methyl ester carboxylesterase n=1 Tax=Pedobacter duraquae TaxID=425511 RepID=A0A4R6IKF4_9SPHI|nr:alpha/beta hydrolase [Pedobacter duraquae]TDO22527.1 pimeloyl-ACP methyl ester carboxylesterase [Pedobacter duraquae]
MKTTKTLNYALGASVLLTAILGSGSAIAQQKAPVKNIVIVHGAFADASGWEAVHNILVKDGYKVTLVQNPTSSLAEDVAATKFALDRQDGPAVLVGHSWGGTVITEAGNSDKVASLVYVAAFVPDGGESTLALVNTVATAPKGILAPDAQGNVYLGKATFQETFANGQTKEKSDFMYDSQIPLTVKSFTDKITVPAWKSKPVYAVKPSNDETIDMGLEDTMYKRANAKVTHIKGGHTLFMTSPKEVAAVIEDAAKGK